MNPFDFTGPVFLLFYLCLAIAAGIASYFCNRIMESREEIDIPKLDDPYLIAALRGGPNEAIRVATISLIDRGLIKANTLNMLAAAKDASLLVKRDIERKICDALPCDTKKLFNDSRVKESSNFYKSILEKHGLLPDGQTYLSRFFWFMFFGVILTGVSAYKIYLALHRGRPFGFLIILTLISLAALAVIIGKSRTGFGDYVLSRLKVDYGRLRSNSRKIVPGGQTNELVLCAAIFGVASLPSETYPYAKQLFPRANDRLYFSCGGSGCGCAGGGCAGGGCGGGGCGGGCGGCGGCGG